MHEILICSANEDLLTALHASSGAEGVRLTVCRRGMDAVRALTALSSSVVIEVKVIEALQTVFGDPSQHLGSRSDLRDHGGPCGRRRSPDDPDLAQLPVRGGAAGGSGDQGEGCSRRDGGQGRCRLRSALEYGHDVRSSQARAGHDVSGVRKELDVSVDTRNVPLLHIVFPDGGGKYLGADIFRRKPDESDHHSGTQGPA